MEELIAALSDNVVPEMPGLAPAFSEGKKEMFDDTPHQLRLKVVLRRDHEHMTRSNAGKKRNRLPAGTAPWKGSVTLDPSYGSALEMAAKLSGDLAPSLYLQVLLSQIVERDEQGNVVLPVVDPASSRALEAHQTAA